jgi:hypothetical protein
MGENRMGTQVFGIVGPGNYGDGGRIVNNRYERTGGQVVQAAHAGYYEAVKRGRVFIGSTAILGQAIPIYSAKANALTLWNPAGNMYDLVLLATTIGHHSTTGLMGVVSYAYVQPAGAVAATGNPFATCTAVVPVNAYIGGGYASTAIFSCATNTTTANPTVLQPFCSVLPVTSAQTIQPYQVIDYVDGRIVIPPGAAIQLVGTTAVAIVAQQSFIWEEVPL